MATLSLNITVPDDKATEILDAFAADKGYDSTSGLTKAQFLKREVIEFVRAAYLEQKLATAQQVTKTTVQNEVNSVPMT